MKRIYTIIALAVCALSFAPCLGAQECPNNDEQCRNKEEKGFFIGIEGGAATGVSTFKSDKPSLQMNLSGGYRFNKWFSVELGLGGGRFGIIPQSCCSAHSGINNERNSYWRSFVDDEWHYYADKTNDGWWYADMNGTTSYFKGALQANFDLLSFFTDKAGLELSPRVGLMSTRTELSGISSLTGNELSLKNAAQAHLLYGGEATVSYKFDNGIKLGVFAALDMLAGKHFDNIPVHVHTENYIWDAGIKVVYSFGKKRKNNASTAIAATDGPVIVPPVPASKDSETEAPAVTVVATPETVEKTEQEQISVVPEFTPIYFDNNSAVVPDSQKVALQSVVQYLKKNIDRRILVAGHTSNIGTTQYNQVLSEKRCLAVKQLLVAEGIEGDRIDINPCGIDNKAESAEKARRVEIIVITLE